MRPLHRFLLLVAATTLPAATDDAHPAAVALLGPSGSGKSETGNTLLGTGHFRVSGGLESETAVPQASDVAFGGRQWQVIDTPGYFDTTRTAEELESSMEQFTDIVVNRIAALVFVVPYGRFGDAHIRAWRLVRGAFGPAAVNYTLLLFTSCGDKVEDDIKSETFRMCAKVPQPALCRVLADLGVGTFATIEKVIAFGNLIPERRARDRDRLFAAVSTLERNNGGAGLAVSDFLQARSRRRLLRKRILALKSEEDRRVLEILLEGVESGSQSDFELMRRLEQLEGTGETERIFVDFEDRTLWPFQQVGKGLPGWRQPIPMPYVGMRGYSTASGRGESLFLHTGTDSGVRVRHGDQRIGELRSAPFFLGRGSISMEATGGGGFWALCRAAEGDSGAGCIERRFQYRSTTLSTVVIGEEELAELLGTAVYMRLVDDSPAGWGFVAIDNLEYPVLVQPNHTSEVHGDVGSDDEQAVKSDRQQAAGDSTTDMLPTNTDSVTLDGTSQKQVEAADGQATGSSTADAFVSHQNLAVQPTSQDQVQIKSDANASSNF